MHADCVIRVKSKNVQEEKKLMQIKSGFKKDRKDGKIDMFRLQKVSVVKVHNLSLPK